MTLTRVALGFLAVAALFLGAGWVSGSGKRGNAVAPAAEALALTLLGALWFASLGTGGWVPVFLLIGVLAAVFGAQAGIGRASPASKTPIITSSFVVIRYLVAGGLLALILG